MKSTVKDYEIQVGQEVWVTVFSLFRYTAEQSEGKGFGRITRLFESELGPAFYFYDEINGGERVGLVKNIIMKPTSGMINNLSSKRIELKEGSKKKKEK